MKKLVLSLVLIVTVSAATRADDITLANGVVLKNATITKTDAAFATITHDAGITRVKIAELPETLRPADYTPEVAAEAIAADKRAQAEAAAAGARREQEAWALEKAQRAEQAQAKRIEEATRKIESLAAKVRFQVVSVVEGEGVVARPAGTEEDVFVIGPTKGLVDGQWMTSVLYPAGTYSFTTVLGATRTVERFALSARDALATTE